MSHRTLYKDTAYLQGMDEEQAKFRYLLLGQIMMLF
jgi:hypothetical protein